MPVFARFCAALARRTLPMQLRPLIALSGPSLLALSLLWTLPQSVAENPGRALAATEEEPCPKDAQGYNSPFEAAIVCANCHSAATRATAMKGVTGEDLSPYGLWEGSMMANSFHDPFWRAQMALERGRATGLGHEDPTGLCVRCHAPVAHHDAVFRGKKEPTFHEAGKNKLAVEGVTCTVCHQIPAEGLGEESTFDGRIKISRKFEIFGPYPGPPMNPMNAFSGYTPVHAPHVQQSELCAGCHTLRTQHAPDSELFAEQTPYLEWKHSIYAEPGEDAKSCQACHMPDQGSLRIARNPMGRDFNIEKRPNYRAHTFVGANVYMLELMASAAEDLGIEEREGALRRNAGATRVFLTDQAAKMKIQGIERKGDQLAFDVAIQNLAGHKLPTGYPSRRVVLHLEVRSGRRTLFATGQINGEGRLVQAKDEHDLPHRSVVRRPEDVVVYEMVGTDAAGQPTTSLTAMAGKRKDNRLLPRGYKQEGPFAAATAAHLGSEDPDFVAGGDTVRFELDLAESAGESLIIVAWLRMQTVPPTWIDPLRALDDEDAKRFVALYDERPDEGTDLAFEFVRVER